MPLVAKMSYDSDDEEESKACDNYRVDMTASNFGDCVCGQPKAEHKAGAARPRQGSVKQFMPTAAPAPAAAPTPPPPKPAPAPAPAPPPKPAPAPAAPASMPSARFAPTVGGFVPSPAPAPAPVPAPKPAPAPTPPPAEPMAATGACSDYRIDMEAANFGTCKCGVPKSAILLLLPSASF